MCNIMFCTLIFNRVTYIPPPNYISFEGRASLRQTVTMKGTVEGCPSLSRATLLRLREVKGGTMGNRNQKPALPWARVKVSTKQKLCWVILFSYASVL